MAIEPPTALWRGMEGTGRTNTPGISSPTFWFPHGVSDWRIWMISLERLATLAERRAENRSGLRWE